MSHTVARERLSSLAGLLSALSALVAGAAVAERASAQRLQEQQRAVDGAMECISLAESRSPGDPTDGPRLRVVDQSPDVVWAEVDRAVLAHGRPLDVFVEVQASAQLGGLVLSFGNTQIDSDMRCRIASNRGAREFVFASGTSMANIQAAFNYLSGAGFVALLRPTGVEVDTEGFGADSFVSVRFSQIGRTEPAAGLYRMMPHAFGVPDPSSRVRFDSFAAAHGVTDFGRDVRAVVNGWPAFSDGPVVFARSPWLRADFELTTGEAIGVANAQTLGEFRAFRVEWR